MGLLSSAGKDAGIEAAREAHAAVDGALSTIDHEMIPAATAAAKAIVGETVNGLYSVFVDMSNRLNGAELPIDITATLRITGKIGALKLGNPEVMADPQRIEVSG